MKTLTRNSFSIHVLFAAIVVFFSSCVNDDPEPGGKYSSGAFILNEGGYGHGNASVSFYSYTGDSVVSDIFSNANARPLGDVLQSAVIGDNLVYMVLNGSNRIEVVNQQDFSGIGVIEDLNGPRYMALSNGKGYVSQWGDNGKIIVVNLASFSVTKGIAVGAGPEDILIHGDNLLVANSGGYGTDSTVFVIGLAEETVTDTIQVGYNPSQLVTDKNNDIWVLCTGSVEYDESWNPVGHKPSKLVRLSSEDYSIEDEITLFAQQHPIRLDINSEGTSLFIGGGYGFTGIYTINITDTEFSNTPLIGSKSFYGYSYNSITKEIYAMEAPSFTENGLFHRYSESGNLIKTYEVGVGPNGAIF